MDDVTANDASRATVTDSAATGSATSPETPSADNTDNSLDGHFGGFDNPDDNDEPASEPEPEPATTTPPPAETATPAPTPKDDEIAKPDPETIEGRVAIIKAEAEKHGFASSEEYIRVMANRENALSEQENKLWQTLQADVANGKLSSEYAEQFLQQQMDAYTGNYDNALRGELAARKQEQERTELQTRKIEADFADAKRANPLLGANDDAAKPLVTALALLGHGTHDSVLKSVGDLLTKAGEQAVAAYVAKTNGATNIAPVIPAGGGALSIDESDGGSLPWDVELVRNASRRG